MTWADRNRWPPSVVATVAPPRRWFRSVPQQAGAVCSPPSATAPSLQRRHRIRRIRVLLPCSQRRPPPCRSRRIRPASDAVPPGREPGKRGLAWSGTRRSALSSSPRSRPQTKRRRLRRLFRIRRQQTHGAHREKDRPPAGCCRSRQHRTGDSQPSSRPLPQSKRCGRAGQQGLDHGQPTSVAGSSQTALVGNNDIMPSRMLDVPLLFLHEPGVKPVRNRNTVSQF